MSEIFWALHGIHVSSNRCGDSGRCFDIGVLWNVPPQDPKAHYPNIQLRPVSWYVYYARRSGPLAIQTAFTSFIQSRAAAESCEAKSWSFCCCNVIIYSFYCRGPDIRTRRTDFRHSCVIRSGFAAIFVFRLWSDRPAHKFHKGLKTVKNLSSFEPLLSTPDPLDGQHSETVKFFETTT